MATAPHDKFRPPAKECLEKALAGDITATKEVLTGSPENGRTALAGDPICQRKAIKELAITLLEAGHQQRFNPPQVPKKVRDPSRPKVTEISPYRARLLEDRIRTQGLYALESKVDPLPKSRIHLRISICCC